MSLLQSSKTTNQLPALFSSQIAEFLFAKLRDEHPYMKIDAIHDIVTATMGTLEQKMKDHQAAEDEAKKRSSFMSLPLDLRLLIYDLALRPENDGDGGVAKCRAIFLGTHSPYPLPSETRDGYSITTWIQQPAITMLNRHIRFETLPVYYGCNIVVFVAHWVKFCNKRGTMDLKQWFERIGAQNRALIEHLDIICEMRVDSPWRKSRQDLEAWLLQRDVPLPKSAKYLGIYRSKTSNDRFWWPVDSAAPTEDQLSSLRITESSLAYSLVDREDIASWNMESFEDEDDPGDL